MSVVNLPIELHNTIVSSPLNKEKALLISDHFIRETTLMLLALPIDIQMGIVSYGSLGTTCPFYFMYTSHFSTTTLVLCFNK